MKQRIILFIILPVLLSSCWLSSNNNNKPVNQEETIYTPDIVWTLNTKCCYGTWFTNQYGRYYYIVEYDSNDGEDFFYSKVDLTNGNKVWSSKVFPFKAHAVPLKVKLNNKDCIIIAGHHSVTYILDDENGELLASIVFYQEYLSEQFDIFNRNSYSWVFVDNCLYWGSHVSDEIGDDGNIIINSNPQGLVKLDLSKVDFTKPAEEEQFIEPVMAWTNNDDRQIIYMYPVVKDDIIYFVTRDKWEKQGYCNIGAFDTVSGKLKWKKKSNSLTGNGWNNMCIADDKLYVIEVGQGCYDLKTGETIWEQRQEVEELKDNYGIEASIYSRGITYWEGKLYFTNITSWTAASTLGVDEKYINNIECIDANTGKFIWGDMPKDSGSLDTKPHIVNGKCLVVAWDNLRVYDAVNGNLIGVDNSFISCGKELNASYEDLFVFFDNDPKNITSVLTAIRIGK